MNQQIQHRMSNPASPWVALGLLAVAGFVGYRYYTENQKKKTERDGYEKPEAQILPPSAWSVDPNQSVPPMEVEAGQLYKAVVTTPLTAPQDGTIPEYEISYLPNNAFNVLEVSQQMLHDETHGLGAEVTITFIPKVAQDFEGDAFIILESQVPPVFRSLSLRIPR
jgi:hypothetical protein